MRVLLDTNIIIHREAGKIVNEDIGMLFYWLDKLKYTKCVHPLTISELKRNINTDTSKTMEIKVAAYNILKTEAILTDDLKKVCDPVDKTPNDNTDTKLLNEVYSGRVDFLISEDKKIHFKAKLLDISERVFRIDNFLERLISENPGLVDYKVLSVRKEFFGNIDLKDQFFDSFRLDYNGFNKWFNSKSDETAYICVINGILSAFLYIKYEDESENYHNIKPILEPKKRLKIGTLKVTSNGIKLGERFLKIVFDNARQYHVNEIYVTIFDKRPEQLRLISLLEDFGFKYHGEKISVSGAEKVYVRNFARNNANTNYPRLTYPWLSRNATVFIVPIRPEYHTKLLPDSILRTESPRDFVEDEPYRNAISKVYLSHSTNRDIKPGDILLFYRSGGIYKGVTTTIGIVENIVTEILSLDDLIEICRKRTVLTEDELKEYWQRFPKRRPFVINFLYAFSFKRRLTLKELLDRGLLPSMDTIKTINKIAWQAFEQLIILSKI